MGSYENVAIDCLEELDSLRHLPPEEKAGLGPEFFGRPLDGWLPRYMGCPDNVHLFLSTLFLQLFALLDYEPDQTIGTIVDRAPTVSLMLCLSKLHQLRVECVKTKATMLPHRVMSHLLPAMWGLEVHIRRSQNDVRMDLMDEVSTREQGLQDSAQIAAADPSRHTWVKGSVWGFKLPANLLSTDLSQLQEWPDHWMWHKWVWPQDVLMQMCCRIAQVARLSLGVSQPLACWHPCDPARELGKVFKLLRQDKGNDEMLGMARDWPLGRGWKQPKSERRQEETTRAMDDSGVFREESDDAGFAGTYGHVRHGGFLIQKTTEELRNDILNTRALDVIFTCINGGIDPFGDQFVMKTAKWQTATFKRHADLYTGLLALLCTHFGGECRSRKHMCCVGEPFGKLLHGGLALGAARVVYLSQTLALNLGLDTESIEVMLDVAHGFMQNENGEQLAKSAVAALASRLRMAPGGEHVLASVCSKRWSMKSATVLAHQLRTHPKVVHGIIEASRNHVSGWLTLHQYLFKQAKKDKEADKWKVGSLLDTLVAENKKNVRKTVQAVVGQQGQMKELEKEDWEVRMTRACMSFDSACRKLSDNRLGTVTQQRAWLSSIMKAILPRLTTSVYEGGGQVPQEAMELIRSIISLLLHILSGQNTAATQILLENEKLLSATGLDPKTTGTYLRDLMLLAQSSGEMDRATMVATMNAAGNLVEPLVQFIKRPSGHTSSLPTEERDTEDWERSEVPQEEKIRGRVKLLLDCMFGMILKNNKRVLKAMVQVMESGVERLVEENWQLLSDPATGKCRAFVYEPMKPEIVQLMRSHSLMRALAMVQSLQSVQKLWSDNRQKKWSKAARDADVKGKRGGAALSAMVNSLHGAASRHRAHAAERSISSPQRQPAVQFPQTSTDTLAPETAFSLRDAASGRDAIGSPPSPTVSDLSLEDLLCPSPPAPVAAEVPETADPPGLRVSPQSILEPTLSTLLSEVHDTLGFPAGRPSPPQPPAPGTTKALEAELLPRLGESSERSFPQLPSLPQAWAPQHVHAPSRLAVEQQALNAMMHFFMGLATSKIGAGLDADKMLSDLQVFLPTLGALATGRLEMVLVELRRVALEHCSHQLGEEVALVLDVLALIGFDSSLYKKLDEAESFGFSLYEKVSEDGCTLLPTLLKRLFKNVNVEHKEELFGIMDALFMLLMAVLSEAPPENKQKRLAKLCSPLYQYFIKLLGDDPKLVKAVSTILDTARNVAFKLGEKQTTMDLHEMFSLQDEGTSGQAGEMLMAVTDLLLPFLPRDMREPLLAVLRIASELVNLIENPGSSTFTRRAPVIIENVSIALCVPQHYVKGIVALAQGDWAAATDLCRPFCNLDPEMLRQISKLLPSVSKTVKMATGMNDNVEELTEFTQLNSHLASRVQQIAANAVEGKCTASDLFELVDLDKNGFVSQEEFKILMTRLGFDLNAHRIAEIMSTCKKKHRKGRLEGASDSERSQQEGLNEEEFEDALNYLKGKVAVNSLDLLKISWPILSFYLAVLTLLLMLIFIFIFLGMSAFSSGGVFSSVVNSIMTIGAGLGLSKGSAERLDSKNKDAGSSDVKSLVEEVQTTIFGNE